MARSKPLRVRIPAIGLESRLMDLSLRDDGTLAVPPNGFPAGWFTGAPTPGEVGPAVIVGHVRWAGRDGVFAKLPRLRPGDRISVERKDGSTAAFTVTRVQEVAKTEFPSDAVYGDIDHAGLRLITCGGLDPRTRKFTDNVVVFARLVSGAHARS
jgi:sortase (surface protein transpeptidase)